MKKITSLVLVFMLILSLGTMVSAANTTPGTLTIANLTTSDLIVDDYNPNGYYKVDITLTNFDFVYNAINFDVAYDATKFTAGAVIATTTWAGTTTETKYAADCKMGFNATSGPNATIAVKASTPADGVIRLVTQDDANVLDNTYASYQSTNVLFSIYLTPIEGQYGKSEITYTNDYLAYCFAGSGGVENYSLNVVAGSIDLGEDPNGGEVVVPETSTVRTFPKLRWDETNKQLTTVGVITIGKDYDTVKYGINIEKGEGTVNYWANSAVKTTDEKEAYYAVRLDDIDDETTDIKSTSAAKAILSNGAEGDAETKDSVIE